MPGMTTNITVHVEDHSDVLRIQSKALKYNPPKEYYIINNLPVPDTTANKKKNSQPNYYLPGSRARLWVKKGEKLDSVSVILGVSDGNYTEIKGNINDSAEVVLESEVIGKVSGPGKSPFMPNFRGGGKR